jgi:sensor domain CHASE-containing protein
MTLRKKTLIIIGITLIALIAILYGTSRIILLRGFAELEKQSLGQNVERAKSMLFENLAALSSSTADWAAWDDTYEFRTFSELRLNFMLFVNSSGHIVFGKGFDLNDKKEIPIPKSFLKHLSANQKIILQYSDIKSTKGIVLLPDGPVLISSYPIVTSEEKGPIRGTLIMGRYLDSKEIKHLAETTHLSLTINQIKYAQANL